MSSGRLYISDSVTFNESEFPYPTLLSSSNPPNSVSSPQIFTGPTFSIPASIPPVSSSSSSQDLTSSPTVSPLQLHSDIQTTPATTSPATISPATTSIATPSPVSSYVSNIHQMVIRSKAGIHKPRVLTTISSTSSSSAPSKPVCCPQFQKL